MPLCALVAAASAATTQEQLHALAEQVQRLVESNETPVAVVGMEEVRPWLQGLGMAASIGFVAIMWIAFAIFVVQWRTNRVLALISRSVEQNIPLVKVDAAAA